MTKPGTRSDFANDDGWSKSNNYAALSPSPWDDDDVGSIVVPRRHVKKATSFDHSITPSRDFRTMDLELSSESSYRESSRFSDLSADEETKCVTNAATDRSTRSKAREAVARSKSDVVQMKQCSRDNSTKSLIRAASDTPDVAPLKPSRKQSSIRRSGADQHHRPKKNTHEAESGSTRRTPRGSHRMSLLEPPSNDEVESLGHDDVESANKEEPAVPRWSNSNDYAVLAPSPWDDDDAGSIGVPHRRVKKDTSFDHSFTLSRDFQTMDLELASESSYRESSRFSDLSADEETKCVTNAATDRTTRPKAREAVARSKSDVHMKPVRRDNKPRPVRRAASDTQDVAPLKPPRKQSSIRRSGGLSTKSQSQRLERTSSRRDIRVDDDGQITTSEPSSPRRETHRNTSDKVRHSRYAEKKPGTDQHRRPKKDTHEAESGSTRRTPQGSHRMSPPEPPSNDEAQSLAQVDVESANKEETAVPRTRKLARRNSFVKLRRSSSSRSIGGGGGAANHDDRARAKVTALTALVLATRKPGLAEQRQRVEKHDLSLTSDDLTALRVLDQTATASAAATTHMGTFQAPVIQEDAHPVLCILSGDLWSDDKAIVEGALNQLIKLCCEDDQNQSIFSLAGYCPLCGVIRKWYNNKEILIAGFHLLQLASENFAVGAFGCGALESVVGAMNNHAKDGPLQAAACGALAAIVSTSQSGPALKLVAGLNGVQVLVKVMNSFPDSIAVQQKASATFVSMARFPQLHDYLEEGTAVVHASLDKFGAITSLAHQMAVKKEENNGLNNPTARVA